MGQKIIKIAVDSGSDIIFSISGSYDGNAFTETIKSETTLSPGKYILVHISDFYAAIEIYAKSKNIGQPGRVVTQCIATSLTSSGGSSSSTNIVTLNNTMEAIGFETLPISANAVTSLTQSVYNDSSAALVSVEGSSVRVCWDGSVPTNTTGHLILDGGIVYLESSSDLNHFQAISSSGSSKLSVTYSHQVVT
jgi:hypothetical protein